MLKLSTAQLKRLGEAVQASGARLYRDPIYKTLDVLAKNVQGQAEESPKYPGSFSLKAALDGGTAYFTVIGDPDAEKFDLVTQVATQDDAQYGIVEGQVRLAAIAL
jgi:hypothetical protein